MKPFRPIISTHRVTRLSAWARLALMWVGQVFLSFSAEPSLRHLRDREWLLNLDFMARLIGRLIVMRAAQIGRLAPKPRGRARRIGPRGVLVRVTPHRVMRAIIGSRLRRRLRHRDFAVRLSRLVDALANLDTHARNQWRRLQTGLTRLAPLIATPAEAQCLASITPPFAAPVADTS